MSDKIEERKLCCICDKRTTCGGNANAKYCCYIVEFTTMTKIIHFLLIGWLILELIYQSAILYLEYEIEFLSKTCHYMWENVLFVAILNMLTIIILLVSAKIYKYTCVFYLFQTLARMISTILCILYIFPANYTNTCFFTNETSIDENVSYNKITWMTIIIGFTFIISCIFYISLIVSKCHNNCKKGYQTEIKQLKTRVQELVEKERELDNLPSAQLVRVTIDNYSETSSSEECEGFYEDSSQDSSDEIPYNNSPEIKSFIQDVINETKQQHVEQI